MSNIVNQFLNLEIETYCNNSQGKATPCNYRTGHAKVEEKDT